MVTSSKPTLTSCPTRRKGTTTGTGMLPEPSFFRSPPADYFGGNSPRRIPVCDWLASPPDNTSSDEALRQSHYPSKLSTALRHPIALDSDASSGLSVRLP